MPEDGTLHSHRRENFKSCIALTGWTLQRRRNVSAVRYELSFYIPEYGALHSNRRENIRSYITFVHKRISGYFHKTVHEVSCDSMRGTKCRTWKYI
jgi:hypothetical protein